MHNQEYFDVSEKIFFVKIGVWKLITNFEIKLVYTFSICSLRKFFKENTIDHKKV